MLQASPTLTGLRLLLTTSRRLGASIIDAMISGLEKARAGNCSIARCTTWDLEQRHRFMGLDFDFDSVPGLV